MTETEFRTKALIYLGACILWVGGDDEPYRNTIAIERAVIMLKRILGDSVDQ